MTALLDANVLIALLVDDHVHHMAAENWFVSTSGNFATCPITQGSLMRLRGPIDDETRTWQRLEGRGNGTIRIEIMGPGKAAAQRENAVRHGV